MILSHAQIEDIAAATTKDFNKFFYRESEHQKRDMPRGTPIDQFASLYLGLDVSFTRLSSDGSLCGVTAYSDTEYIVETDGIRNENRPRYAECGNEGRPPEKERLSACIP